jgi:hypothetical protein
MTEPTPNVRDIGVSIIRTVVPSLWGAALAWLVTQIPALEPVLNESGMTGLGAVIAATLIGLWYALFRSIESKLPAWLTVLVLGSNRPPTYVDGTVNYVRDEGYRPGSSREIL